MVKRIFDLVVAIGSLILLSPLLGFLWLAVVIENGLPGLFRQERMGRDGSPFKLLKFRSMKLALNAKEAGFDAGDLSRVTRIGWVLRKYKLDELPQLWNVIKGDMSLVGPRPEVRIWTEVYPERWAKVLSVRPGITDNASIEFRNEEELLIKADDPEKVYREEVLPRKLALYENYVDNHTLIGDLMIILKTLFAVLFR